MAAQNGERPEPSRDNLLSQAYGASQRRLREAHADEFNQFMVEETQSRGIEWKPRLSPQDKALSEVEKLLTEYPEMAEKLAQRLAEKSK